MNSSVSWRVSLSCSGRLSFCLLRSISLFLLSRRRIDRFVYYPSDSSLASCTTTFCLCKSCQRTLSFCLLSSGVWYRFPESECKSTAFSWTDQIFCELFLEKDAFLGFEWRKSRQIGNMRGIWAERCENIRKWAGGHIYKGWGGRAKYGSGIDERDKGEPKTARNGNRRKATLKCWEIFRLQNSEWWEHQHCEVPSLYHSLCPYLCYDPLGG